MKKIFDLHDQTQRALAEAGHSWEFLFFKKITSTNDYAKENIEKFTPPTLIIADHQTGGRGRGKNTWEDEGNGHQLLCSWIIKFKNKKADPRWTMALGYFVFASLQSTWTTLNFSLKAPNDIYLNDKKMGGLLTETTNVGNDTFLILGLGLNIFARPSEHHDIACALIENIDGLNTHDWQKFSKTLAAYLNGFEKFVAEKNWLEKISGPLMVALNKNLHHKTNPILGIKTDGSLQLHQGYLSWLEL